jgi:hypothetical protein
LGSKEMNSSRLLHDVVDLRRFAKYNSNSLFIRPLHKGSSMAEKSMVLGIMGVKVSLLLRFYLG